MNEHQKQTRTALKKAGLSDKEIDEIITWGESMSKHLDRAGVSHKAVKMTTVAQELADLKTTVKALQQQVAALTQQDTKQVAPEPLVGGAALTEALFTPRKSAKQTAQVTRQRKAIKKELKAAADQGSGAAALFDMLFPGK